MCLWWPVNQDPTRGCIAQIDSAAAGAPSELLVQRNVIWATTLLEVSQRATESADQSWSGGGVLENFSLPVAFDVRVVCGWPSRTTR